MLFSRHLNYFPSIYAGQEVTSSLSFVSRLLFLIRAFYPVFYPLPYQLVESVIRNSWDNKGMKIKVYSEIYALLYRLVEPVIRNSWKIYVNVLRRLIHSYHTRLSSF